MPNTFNISTDLIVSGSFSATSYSNAPFVTGGTYTSGTITFGNATGGTFSVTGLPVGGQGGQLYYFNTSVNQTPYKEFGPTGITVSEQLTTISVASGVTSTVQSYLTPSGYPNSIILPGGVWSFYLHSYKQDSSSSFDLYCDVYKRTSGGTETYLFSTDPFDVTSTASTPTMAITDGYYSGTPLNVSDRILVLVRATNTGISTKQITFVTEGPLHYSYGITPFNGLPANVSSLTTGTGLSGNATTGAVTLVNTAPDQTVTISGGTGITTGGTYPNFTITNSRPDQTVTISGGTNIQIAGTYPNFGVNFTGTTGSNFTGGTVSGATNFTGGLTANTISATTYSNLPYSGTVRTSGTTTSNYIPKFTGTTALTNSQIQDNGTSIGVGTSPSASYKMYVYSSVNSTTLNVQSQTSGGIGISSLVNGGGGATGISSSAQGGNGYNNIGILGVAQDGLLAIGVQGTLDTSEFGGITTGIGGYFDARAIGGYSAPLNAYSVQLLDGTEGVNKVLISKTSDGKANWSNTLTGLTNVGSTTISAATYQGNVVTKITAGTNITISPTGGTGNVTINSTGGGASLGTVYTTGNNLNFI